MLRNIGKCYCESTHRLLQKYDKKCAKKRIGTQYFFRIMLDSARKQPKNRLERIK
ncbi:Uncharacterised protein [Pseudescherichia vulneris]|nr:Uncharacterised protein [Pseudescherichia vulneris]